jgi:hypothetical protein
MIEKITFIHLILMLIGMKRRFFFKVLDPGLDESVGRVLMLTHLILLLILDNKNNSGLH